MTSPSISPTRLPPRLEDVPEERKGKVKERREVGEGDDTVTIEDTSDDEDGEMLQERFQLRSRFSRPRLPNIPLIVERQASLESSLPALPRRPRNVARKRATKKLKITKSTAQEVSSSSSVVEYFP
jgi:chromatin segregation and condensation protein Rec8/ScpA/Scc1 (kleisin family)